jgi:hypothetical protein
MLNYMSQPSPGTAQLHATSQLALLIFACSLQMPCQEADQSRASSFGQRIVQNEALVIVVLSGLPQLVFSVGTSWPSSSPQRRSALRTFTARSNTFGTSESRVTRHVSK